VIVPLLKEHFSKDVSDRIVDVIKLDAHAPEREILDATIAAMRVKDAETDRERVEALLGAYRSNGLGCAGVEDTRLALERGQVDELFIATAPEILNTDAGMTDRVTTEVEQPWPARLSERRRNASPTNWSSKPGRPQRRFGSSKRPRSWTASEAWALSSGSNCNWPIGSW
jgi:hypothetical protein